MVLGLSLAAASTAGAGPLSPAAGQVAESPGAAAGGPITLTAAPRWGHSSMGQWTSYLVRTSNRSDRDFAGTLTLTPEPAPASAPVSTTTTLEVERPQTVVAIGEIEFTVPEPGTGPRSGSGGSSLGGPGLDHLPQYRMPLSLAAGAEKTVAMVVLEAPYGHRGELRDQSGRSVAASPLPAVPGLFNRAQGNTPARLTAGPTVAVVGDLEATPAEQAGLDGVLGDAARLRSTAELPSTAMELSGLQVLVLARLDTGAPSPAQVQAIRDFVALGGALVLTGGAEGGRTLASLPDELVPLAPTGLGTASLAPLADLVGRSTALSAGVVTGELRRGTVILDTPDGIPLVAEAKVGLGRVIQLTFDPLSEPIASDTVMRGVAWDQGISRAKLRPGGAGAGVGGGATADAQLWSPALDHRGWPRWPPKVLFALVAYAAIGFPLAYLAAKRRRGQRALWLVAPVAAVVVVGLVGVVGSGREGEARSSVEVRTGADDHTVLVESYRGVQAAGKGELNIHLGHDVVAATAFAGPNPFAVPAEDFRYSGPGGGVLTRGGDDGSLSLEAEPGKAQAFQSLAVGREPALASRLRLVESGPADQGGARMTGTVTNRSDRPIRKLRAQLPEGGLARLADVIAAGQTIEVDVTFVWPRSIEAGTGLPAPSDEVLMYAVARRPFTRAGQVAVLGLAGPPSQGRGGRSEVVMEVADFEGDDRSVTNLLGGSTPIASADDTFGKTIAYEHVGGAGVGPLGLSYSTYADPPEVYDWASRTWRLMPPGNRSAGTGDTLPLEDTEVGPGGLVRTRSKSLNGVAGGTLVPLRR